MRRGGAETEGGEGGAARRRPPAGGRPLAARRAGRDMWPCWLCPQVPGAMAPPKDIMTNSYFFSSLFTRIKHHHQALDYRIPV